MTAPAPPGGPSPLRVGGLALLGVGAVAAVFGIGTLVTGGGDSSTATAPTSTSAPVTPTAGATPTGPGVTVPSFGPTPTNAIAAPTSVPGAGADGSGSAGGSGSSGAGSAGSGGSSGGSQGGGSQAVAKSPVRVYNNSTIKGLAARAADDFRNEGWTVTAVANYPYGNIPTSTVYYRSGTVEQAGAQAMADQFGMRAEPRFTGLDEASPGLIVIVTNDYQQR